MNGIFYTVGDASFFEISFWRSPSFGGLLSYDFSAVQKNDLSTEETVEKSSDCRRVFFSGRCRKNAVCAGTLSAIFDDGISCGVSLP